MKYFEISYIETTFIRISAIGGACMGFLFGGWHQYLTILIVMQAIDLITGFYKAKMKYGLSSEEMYRGLFKKFAVWLVVVMAHMIDLILFEGHVLQAAVAFAYIANEGLSAAENLGEIGVLVPEPILKYLKQIKIKSDDLTEEEKGSN